MSRLTYAEQKRLRWQHQLEQASMRLVDIHRQRAERAEAAGDSRKADHHRRQMNAALKKAGGR